MQRRMSIHIDELKHENPIPAGCRIGNLITTGVINGVDPATGQVADGPEAQCAHMFQHVRRIVEAGGGGTDDIIKMTVWMQNRSQREFLNREWLAMFPDEHSRPARHALQSPEKSKFLIQCVFEAVLAD